MKKTSIFVTLLLSLVFAFTGAQAQVITADRAKAIANSFFSSGMQKSGAARGVSSEALTQSYDSNTLLGEFAGEAPTFHVIANPGGGFVIVSGEEVENPIIGYSFDNEFAADGVLSDGLADYLKDIDAQVRALREYNAENPQKAAASRSAMQKASYNATSMGNIVKELETAKWDQEPPFNNLCFTTAGKPALTGCVPTAYAILCHYYKWPVAATGDGYHSGTGEKITFGHEYDYENMLYDYSKGYNDAQATAVATLMRDLGYAYQVAYGESDTPSGSGGEGAAVLISQFGFKSLSTTHTSATYATAREDDATWVSLIKNSLDQNHPIPYSAFNPNSGARHIFVLDGYTDNGYYHFNFGWGGADNGWFTLDNVAPNSSKQYTQSHKAYFELIPNRTEYPVSVSVSPANAGTVSINGGDASAEVEGSYYEGQNLTLRATNNSGYTFSHWSKGGVQVSEANPYTAKVASSDNEYVANFLTVGNTTVNVTVNYNSSYGTVTYNSNTVSGTGITPYQNSEVTLVATPLDGYVFNGWTVTKGTESTNYSGTSLTFVATGEMSVTANFALAVVDYNMIIDNVSPSGSLTGARNSTWTYNTDNNHPAALKLQSSNGSKEVNGLSNSYNRLYAYVYDAKDTGYSSATYTLSVPDGYIITSYNLTYSVYNSYIGQVTVSNGTTTETPNDTNNHSLTATPNAQTAQFTISTSQSGQQYITIKSFIVTVMKDGAGGGAPTQYTITATANPVTAGNVTGGGTYNEGATVTLTATPASGYHFVNWTNNLNTDIVTENPYTPTAAADVTYTANFAKNSYELTYIVDGVETTHNVVYGASLPAAPATEKTGYTFTSWDKEVPATMPAEDVTLTAQFTINSYELTYIVEGVETTHNVVYGASLPAAPATEKAGYTFTGWDKEVPATMPAEDVTLTAQFQQNVVTPTYYNVSVNPADTNGSVNAEYIGTGKKVEAGTEVTLTATPNDSFEFDGWYIGENLVTKENPYTFAVNSNISYTAKFKEQEVADSYKINVTIEGGGSVSGYDANADYIAGSTVTLTATPNAECIFDGWYDGETLVSPNAQYQVVVNENIDYTAKFVVSGNICTISLTTNGTLVNGTNVLAQLEHLTTKYPSSLTVAAGKRVTLLATEDYNQKGYLFDGWYLNGVKVSGETSYTFTAEKTVAYEARFFKGYEVIGKTTANAIGRVIGVTYANGDPIPGTATSGRAVAREGDEVKFQVNMYEEGYELFVCKDDADNVVETVIEQPNNNNFGYFTVTVTGNNTYTMQIVPVTYNISAYVNGTGGSVTVTSSLQSGASVKVPYNETATITAVPAVGYSFSHWTKDGEPIDGDATLTIPAYGNFNDVEDAEYFAYFAELEAGNAGYYRIAYDFEVPVAAKSAATRAATDETQTYVVSPNTGTPNDAGTFNSSWTYTKNGAYQADLTMASTSNGNPVNKINTMNNGSQHSLVAYYKVNNVVYGVTYTVSVPENGNYKIAGYSIRYTAYQDVTVNSTATNNGKTGSIQATGLDVYSFDFTVSSTSNSGAIDITEFEVYIEYVGDAGEGGGETPEPETETKRLYMQSEACGVSGNENALQMAEDNTGAASIFYFDGLNLLSYTKGTYLREEDTYKGLQGVGEAGGTVQILADDGTAVITAPNYLHAEAENGEYFVSSDTDNSHVNEHKFVVETVTSLPVTIGSVGYSTFYAPVAVSLPNGVKAYYLAPGNLSETMAIMTEIVSKKVPKNTAVVLGAQMEGTYDLTIIDDNDVTEEYDNLLSGTVAATYVTDEAYVLSNGLDGIGFYRAIRNQQGAFLNNSHKIYLSANQPSPIPQFSAGFRLFFGGTTGIEYIYGEGVEGSIYDLSGRKLEGITAPGVYIVNGQKVLVK